jgi:hypothetical protein
LLAELNAQAKAEAELQMVEHERLRKCMEQEAQGRMPAMSRIFDVSFGPTLESSLNAIADALTKDDGPGLNVMIANKLDGNLAVRSVQLQRVSLNSALRTLQMMLVNPNGVPTVRIEVSPTSNNEERPVVTVLPSPGIVRDAKETAYNLAVFRVDALNDVQEPEDRARVEKEHSTTMEAIEVGLEIVGRSPDFKIKLHPATGMMFVHGTRNELRVVAEVLGQDVPSEIQTTQPTPTPQPTPSAQPTPSLKPASNPIAPTNSSGAR